MKKGQIMCGAPRWYSFRRQTAFFLAAFLAAGATAEAQAPSGAGFLERLRAAEARVQKLPVNRRGARRPVEINVHVDANAVIADWRARDPSSQSGTQRRSGVRINGTPSNALAGARQILFACPAGAFLDVTAGRPDGKGGYVFEGGARDGCGPGEALMLENGVLFCGWYTPAALAPARPTHPEIVISTRPPQAMLGECITRSAEVLPAWAFPAGRPQAGRGPCAGSGVTINGRATGHSANCQ